MESLLGENPCLLWMNWSPLSFLKTRMTPIETGHLPPCGLNSPPGRLLETLQRNSLLKPLGSLGWQIKKDHGFTEQRGSLDLEFLKEYSSEEALNWLLKFKGVGLKTASIVLQFSLGKPAFPVDTHIYRISGRLGLRPPKMNVIKTHKHLAEQFPPETYHTAHLNLIRLGREICSARNPKCEQCPLQEYCVYYRELQAA